MKAKVLFTTLFVSFFAFATIQAQTVKEVFDGPWERVMVECDGDYLSGTCEGINLTHFNKDGYVDWVISTLKAEVVSASTGEVFKVSQYTKHKMNKPGETDYFTFHQNYVGDMGTHYQIAVTFEIDPSGVWTPIKEKANCF
jgi:hypothetical protein